MFTYDPKAFAHGKGNYFVVHCNQHGPTFAVQLFENENDAKANADERTQRAKKIGQWLVEVLKCIVPLNTSTDLELNYTYKVYNRNDGHAAKS